MALELQVISDLHLETPLIQPVYRSYKLGAHADHLLLLGDIGLLKDEGLYRFLSRLLRSNPLVRVFYLLGNHEYYQLSVRDATYQARNLESRLRAQFGTRFTLLDRTRVDLTGNDADSEAHLTILGCTLWSNVPAEEAAEIQYLLTDFNAERGIQGHSVTDHNSAHQTDLAWLDEQVLEIQAKEPNRQIIIATHHSPTVDPRANDPKHNSSGVNSGFRTNLLSHACWTSSNVKAWVFGHTHYDCAYRDEQTGKVVLANQKGYTSLGTTSQAKTAIIRALASEPWSWDVQIRPVSMVFESAKSPNQKQRSNEPAEGSKVRKFLQFFRK